MQVESRKENKKRKKKSRSGAEENAEIGTLNHASFGTLLTCRWHRFAVNVYGLPANA